MTDINHKPTPLDIYPSVAHEDIDSTPVKKEIDLHPALQGVNEVKDSPLLLPNIQRLVVLKSQM